MFYTAQIGANEYQTFGRLVRLRYDKSTRPLANMDTFGQLIFSAKPPHLNTITGPRNIGHSTTNEVGA